MAANPRIERVARAMCRVAGIDPDYRDRVDGPAWAGKMPEARMHVAAFDELRAIEREQQAAYEYERVYAEARAAILPEER